MNINNTVPAFNSAQIQDKLKEIQSSSPEIQERFLAGLAQFVGDFPTPVVEASTQSMLTPDQMSLTDRMTLAKSLVTSLSPVLSQLSKNPEVSRAMQGLFSSAQEAKPVLATLSSDHKTKTLHDMATALRDASKEILAVNKDEVAQARNNGLPAARLDRLTLTEGRLEDMAKSIDQIAEQLDPIGRSIQEWSIAEKGLNFKKVAVPLGVIGMIYESRPNVTSDAAAIGFKSGNPVVLRPGSDCYQTSQAIVKALQNALSSNNISEGAIQLVPTTDRAAVSEMLGARGQVDLIIPRGGLSLTQRVFDEAKVPTLLHLDGNCHTYVDKDADAEKAIEIVTNAKMRRTGICGATESLLIHKDRLEELLPVLVEVLATDNKCELVGDSRAVQADNSNKILPAEEGDYTREFLGPKLSIQVVDSRDEAIAVINENSSKHTECIISEAPSAQADFQRKIQSAIIMTNASTQNADGGQFGFGAEIGISTGTQPPRGPVGADQLTSFCYHVEGTDSGDRGIRPGGTEVYNRDQVKEMLKLQSIA